MKNLFPYTGTVISESVRVRQIVPQALEVQLIGYISRAASRHALDRARELLEVSPGIDTILWDLSLHTHSDPGNLAMSVRWMRGHGASIRSSLVVSSNALILGMVQVGRVLLPDRDLRVYARREDALAELRRHGSKARRSAA